MLNIITYIFFTNEQLSKLVSRDRFKKVFYDVGKTTGLVRVTWAVSDQDNKVACPCEWWKRDM